MCNVKLIRLYIQGMDANSQMLIFMLVINTHFIIHYLISLVPKVKVIAMSRIWFSII